MFFAENIRRALVKEAAESGHPLDYIEALQDVIETLLEENPTDADIVDEAWGE
jgi:hypothetical protein